MASVKVTYGKSCTIAKVRKGIAETGTARLRVYEYRDPQTNRFNRLFKCDFKGCFTTFRTLTNFFDH